MGINPPIRGSIAINSLHSPDPDGFNPPIRGSIGNQKSSDSHRKGVSIPPIRGSIGVSTYGKQKNKLVSIPL